MKFRIIDRGDNWAYRYQTDKKFSLWPFWLSISRGVYQTLDQAKAAIANVKAGRHPQTIYEEAENVTVETII